MEDAKALSETLSEIRQIMAASMRFFSLGGPGGIAAGICGITGSLVVAFLLKAPTLVLSYGSLPAPRSSLDRIFREPVFLVAGCTFIAAFTLAFLLTWMKSNSAQTALLGPAGKRLLFHVAVPMVIGGIFLLKIAQDGQLELILPGSLLFYGLAILAGSRFTFPVSKFLALGEITLGLVSLWLPAYGLICWMAGFGILHILFGLATWRGNPEEG